MKSEEAVSTPIRKLFGDYLVLRFVPFQGKKIDLLFVSDNVLTAFGMTDDIDLIAVELKWQNWRQALRQSYVNQVCTDKAFVGMPEKHVPKNVTQFVNHGIGLIAANGYARIAVDSSYRRYTMPRLKTQLLSRVYDMLNKQRVLFAESTSILP